MLRCKMMVRQTQLYEYVRVQHVILSVSAVYVPIVQLHVQSYFLQVIRYLPLPGGSSKEGTKAARCIVKRIVG